ncbi:PLD nuclease N-terminal domain-containing protein [Propionibacteriaceae bacterium Y2011]
MARYLPLIIIALLMIYCVVEVAQAPSAAVRRMPKWMWAVTVICLPLVGSLCWLFLGRPTKESLGEGSRVVGPDDDPDFLRRL